MMLEAIVEDDGHEEATRFREISPSRQTRAPIMGATPEIAHRMGGAA